LGPPYLRTHANLWVITLRIFQLKTALVARKSFIKAVNIVRAQISIFAAEITAYQRVDPTAISAYL